MLPNGKQFGRISWPLECKMVALRVNKWWVFHTIEFNTKTRKINRISSEE